MVLQLVRLFHMCMCTVCHDISRISSPMIRCMTESMKPKLKRALHGAGVTSELHSYDCFGKSSCIMANSPLDSLITNALL